MGKTMTTFYDYIRVPVLDLNPTQHHFGGTGRKTKP